MFQRLGFWLDGQMDPGKIPMWRLNMYSLIGLFSWLAYEWSRT